MQGHPQACTIPPQRETSESVDPVLPEFLDAVAMECGSSCPQFPTRVPSEIVDGDSAQVNLSKCHRATVTSRFCGVSGYFFGNHSSNGRVVVLMEVPVIMRRRQHRTGADTSQFEAGIESSSSCMVTRSIHFLIGISRRLLTRSL